MVRRLTLLVQGHIDAPRWILIQNRDVLQIDPGVAETFNRVASKIVIPDGSHQTDPCAQRSNVVGEIRRSTPEARAIRE
jgi:hypothetical protein